MCLAGPLSWPGQLQTVICIFAAFPSTALMCKATHWLTKACSQLPPADAAAACVCCRAAQRRLAPYRCYTSSKPSLLDMGQSLLQGSAEQPRSARSCMASMRPLPDMDYAARVHRDSGHQPNAESCVSSMLPPPDKCLPMLQGSTEKLGTSTVLRVEQAQQEFVFTEVPSEPVPSLLRDFSAPVKMEVEGQTDDDLVFLLAHDTGQPELAVHCLHSLVCSPAAHHTSSAGCGTRSYVMATGC